MRPYDEIMGDVAEGKDVSKDELVAAALMGKSIAHLYREDIRALVRPGEKDEMVDLRSQLRLQAIERRDNAMASADPVLWIGPLHPNHPDHGVTLDAAKTLYANLMKEERTEDHEQSN